jgi:hypothetical protein
VNQRVALLAINFAADTTNIDIDDIRRGIELKIPHVL